MKKTGVILALIVMLQWFSGCATKSDVLTAEDEGTSKVYSVDADQAWEIARTVFIWEGADSIEVHRTKGYLLASSEQALGGTLMGAWIEPVDKNDTRVTVVTKRRISMSITTALTETTFHKRFAQAVAIIKEGNRLPATPPE
ncbi:MAG: hypothetical protein NT096_09695 [Proteobacteria bacterium]|nr:hypothetical protein [Pseudomonadota bacterium]